MIDKVVLSQEDEYKFTTQHAQSHYLLSYESFFHHDLGLKRPTEDLTEENHYARQPLKKVQNDVICI